MEQYNDIPWKIINTYFKDNPTALIDHHLVSYNDFFRDGIKQLFKENNPIRFIKGQHEDEFQYQAFLYMGGKSADKFYYGKPVIYDDNGDEHIMYPNEARLRNMNYSFTIHFDLEIDFKIKVYDEIGEVSYENEETITVPKIYLGKFPIMLQSDMCILKGLSREVKYNMGECRNDMGGYFIIDGKEKVIVSQEKFADNTLYIQDKASDVYSYSAKIRSVSEDASKPIRTLAVRMVAEQPSSSNGQIVVSIPNVRKPVPLFIVMRALGVISDKEIIKYCLLDLENNENLIELFRPSIHDAGLIFTQQAALGYIGYLTKGRSNSHTMEILMRYFLPHIGELNFKQKALYLGYIVNRLLRVLIKKDKTTNRDSYSYKRIEVSGMLIYELFREYYTLQKKHIALKMDKEHFYNKTTAKYKNEGFKNLILNNIPLIFGERIVEKGFKRAFKGDWGSEAHTKRPGIIQDLSRLSYWSFLAQLRKTNIHVSADGAKIVGPRWLNGTQWGILCPIHTPDGGNIGFHKHLSIFTHISSEISGYPFIKYLRTLGVTLLEECSIKFLSKSTKVFVNGAWIGASNNIIELYNTLKLHRKNGLFSPFISIRWNIKMQELSILTDAGRPSHPLFSVNGNTVSYQKENVMDMIAADTLKWDDALLGFGKKKESINQYNKKIYNTKELYSQGIDLNQNEAIIEYLDTQEMEGVKLAMYDEDQGNYAKNNITHIEIHPSVILSVMANQVIFPSTNPYPRDLFSCGQSKQAVSVFHTNYQNRMDKTTYFLNYGQIPLVKSRYLNYINNEEHPYGLNAIVAVMCYSGYNVEDAVIINKNALDRGLFRTTYLSTYEAKEDQTKIGNTFINKEFMNVNRNNVVGKKPGYDYSQLDENSGLIRENSIVTDKTILIGMATNSLTSQDAFIDESISAKKGTIGYIDKSFMTRDEAGGRIAKVRIRHLRIPAIGDKFASRAGQKGTIGIVLEEKDMPTTAEGIRPDIIVNPHAFPSRMTIGHLVESLTSKVCCLYGGFGDCTAFVNKGPKDKLFGELLTNAGYSSTGNEILYNGMTGEQLETEIYFGPTYYMRLKHMVKDKINYRARGPRTVLTRQTVQGRANDGGLRVGEMDRDAIIAHGLAGFLNESMMVRGDKYKMAICNKSGTIAVFNESRNIFLSPIVDGPLKFVGNLENELNVVPISRFGRDFSIVEVPYAFKLLYQELLTMNVQMRIITEDNIDQLISLTNNKNIKLLSGHESFNEVITEIKTKLGEVLPSDSPNLGDSKEDNYFIEETPLYDDDLFEPWVGHAAPLESNIQFASNSGPSKPIQVGDKVLYTEAEKHEYSADTLFTVQSIEDDVEAIILSPQSELLFAYIGELFRPPVETKVTMPSPDYVPVSPDYAPVSPDYAPFSPDYAPNSPELAKDGRNVTVTETKTVTGPPELVLPPQDTGFRQYSAAPTQPQQSIGQVADTGDIVMPGDETLHKVYSDEQKLQMYKQQKETTQDDDSPEVIYERDDTGSGSKEETPTTNIIRRVVEKEEDKNLSLLTKLKDDEEKTNILEGGNVKNVNTK